MIKSVCSECGNKKDKVFDIFGDGTVVMCKECVSNFIKNHKNYIVNYPKQYKNIIGGQNEI